MSSPRIALDAFGGDHCPTNEVAGAVEAARDGIEVVLVGDRAGLEQELAKHPGSGELPIEVHHAAQVITMDDSPSKAVRAKADASMPVCFDLVRKGAAQAMVSAGNSGAMLACGLFKYRRIKGVDRPAIVTVLPTERDPVVMLDMGANPVCRPINLVQFAVMGAVYAKVKGGHENPRVAVLSNGTEESKGTDLTRAVHRLLTTHACSDFEYLGYVEGKEAFRGQAEVVVTDGWTGNITLKIGEAAAALVGTFIRREVANRPLAKVGALLMKPAFAAVRRITEPDQYGGAPLLGVDGLAIICHGGSSAVGIANAIRVGARFVDRELTPALSEAVVRNKDLFELAKQAESVAEKGTPQ